MEEAQWKEQNFMELLGSRMLFIKSLERDHLCKLPLISFNFFLVQYVRVKILIINLLVEIY